MRLIVYVNCSDIDHHQKSEIGLIVMRKANHICIQKKAFRNDYKFLLFQ